MSSSELGWHRISPSDLTSDHSVGPSGWAPPSLPFPNEPQQTSGVFQGLYGCQQGPLNSNNQADKSRPGDSETAIGQDIEFPHASFQLLPSVNPLAELYPSFESFYKYPPWNKTTSVNRKKGSRASQACDSCKTTSVNRKRGSRASQACDSCRTRKAKCDEAQPCSHCSENGLTCTYKEMSPHKKDKNVLLLVSTVNNLQRQLSNMERQMGNMHREMNEKFDRLLAQQGAAPVAPVLPADFANGTMDPRAQAFQPESTPDYIAMVSEEEERLNTGVSCHF